MVQVVDPILAFHPAIQSTEGREGAWEIGSKIERGERV